MTIHELKAQAAELGLTPDDVRKHGILTLKATWEHAIAHKKIEIVSRQTEDVTVNQPIQQERNNTCPECNGTGRIMTQPNRDYGDYHEEVDSCPMCGGDGIFWNPPEQIAQDIAVTLNQSTKMQATEIACLIDHPVLAEGELVDPPYGGFYLGKDDRALPLYSGLVDSENDWLNVYSLKPSAPIPPIAFVDNLPDKIWYRRCFKSSNPIRDELLRQMADYVGDCISPQEFETLQNEPLDEYTAAVYLGWLEESKQMLTEALAA